MGYGNGVYKSTDAGKTWTHLGLDDTQHIGRVAIDPKNPNVVFVAAIGHLYAAQSRSRRVPLARRRQDLAEGAVQERRRRRRRRRDRSRRTRSVVYAALWNTRRPPWYTYGRRNGPGGGIFKSTDGGATWKQLAERTADGRASAAAGSRSRRAIRGASTRWSTDFLPEGAGKHAVSRQRRRRGGGGAAARSRRAATPRRCRAGSFDPTMPARRGRRCRATPRSGDAAGTSRRSPSTRRTPTSSTCRTSPCSRSKDGGKTWVPLRGSPGGDDYHQAWVSPDDSEHDDRRQRSGRDHHAQREDRRSARRHVELVAQSADGADLSPLGRLPLSVLGDRRAAGQRRGRRALARQVRRDLDARLGADRRRRRERHDRGRSAASRHHLRRHRARAATSRRTRRCPDRRARAVAEHRARRLDAAARVLEGRSARAVLRESVPVQDDRRREDVDADQSRSHAPRSRRSAEPRRGCRGGHRSQRQARRHLHRRAVAAARAA